MERIKSNKPIISQEHYSGTMLAEAYHVSASPVSVDPELISSQLDENLEKGLISEELHAQALLQLEQLIKGGEGSHGGHVIGHTRTGKPIYNSAHENYTERKKFPKHNGEQRLADAVASGAKGAHGHFAAKHRDWTKEDHEDAAEAHRKAAKDTMHKWGEKQKEAHQHTFKKDPEFTDYKVSGIGREEYSEKHKEELRHLAHKETEHRDAASAHAAFASKGKIKKAEQEEIQAAYKLLGLEELQKGGGEGSRGGRVIGHTKSGKAVYSNFAHPKHENFNAQDHLDAADLHRKKSDSPSIHHDFQVHHYSQSFKHRDAADAMNNFGGKISLEIGKKYRTDSGLGGEFTVKYQGKNKEGKHEFMNVTNEDFHGQKFHVHDDNLHSFIKKAEESTELQKAYETLGLELKKGGGEGSRGGQVVGHTRSGKPIYNEIGPEKKHHYTHEDHEDAASHHRQVQKKYEDAPGVDTASDEGRIKHRYRVGHHKTNADYHEMEADKKAKKHVAGAKGNVFEHHKRKIEIANSRMPEALRNIFNKAEESTELQKAYETLGLELKKGGEGSRGGKIIGHTRSGKPVYVRSSVEIDYPKFSAQDHKDAALMHSDLQQSHARKYNSGTGTESNSVLSKHHGDTARAHLMEAHKKEQAGHDAGLSDDEKKVIADQNQKKAAHHGEMMGHHESMFKHAVNEQKKHQPGSSQHSAYQAEQERHLAEFQRHKSEHERLKK